MSLIARAVQAREKRANTGQPWGPPTDPLPPGIGSQSGETVALQTAAVYGSVALISDSVSTLPIDLFSSADPKTRRVLPPGPLLTKPYAEISRIDWFVQATISLALRGNFYGQIIERDPDLYPTQIMPVHPDRARVRRDPVTGDVEYRFNGKPVRPDDVFHVRYVSVPGELVGLNPIEYLRSTIGLARAAELHGMAFFDNSAVPMGAIEVEDELDEDETLALARNWKQAHQGISRSSLPAVLTGGAKFNAITINPRDSQFLESRQYSQNEIAGMIFRVPPHMIGIIDRSTSWGTGIAQQEQGYVTNTLGGYLGRLEEALTELQPPGRVVKFNVNARLRGDKLQRYQAYSLGTLGGWLSADDVRGEEDMPPLPDGQGDNYMVPINAELLAQALKNLQQPTEPAPPTGGTNGR